ncbi:hypothetical protein BKA66DRAFT_548524 [Pyrenochaeta sp. MPI-SDFR-AT-0127]|nr:hypothetical protein BKA66DRAFT_548524 [Pyrenochaeta sp. MPI-SDFR-AT-0127]
MTNKWDEDLLEGEGRELQIAYEALKGENLALREQVDKHREQAQQWKDEWEKVKTEREQRITGFEKLIEEQQNEMLVSIRKYQEKTRDPKHWCLESLQKTVEALETKLEATNNAFEHTKRHKDMLENDIARLMDNNMRNERHINHLQTAASRRDAYPAFGNITFFSPERGEYFPESSNSSLTPSSTEKADNRPLKPRCNLPEENKRHDTIIANFRKDQPKQRDEQNALDDIMEKIRDCKVGTRCPPAAVEWPKSVKKNVKERQDADDKVQTRAATEGKQPMVDSKEKEELL